MSDAREGAAAARTAATHGHEEETRLRIAIRATGAAVWSIDFLDDGEETFDSRGCELLGLPADRARWPSGTLYRHLHPDDRLLMEEAFAQCMAGRSEPVEYRVQRADGAIRWLQGTGEAQRDAAGRVTRFVGVSFDVTERKAAQDALLAADRRKDEFLAVLAHELRNPLATILYAAESIATQSPNGPNARAIERIERQVQHMARLLDDLLDVARIREGKLALHRERVDLAALVREAALGMRDAAHARGIRLAVAAPRAPLPADVDAVRVTQIVTNLVGNAVKYGRRGGIVEVDVEAAGDAAELRVRDDGIGIPPEVLPQVFEPFVQSPETLARARGGLGIGLALVKLLAELHGGTVAAASAGRDRGSTFSVRVPLEPQP